MRSSLAGSLWALMLGGAGLGIASQVGGPPQGLASDQAAELTVRADDPLPVATSGPVAEETATPPEIADSVPETPPVLDVDTDIAPATAEVETVLTVPDTIATSEPPETPEDEEPVATAAPEEMPIAPDAENEVVVAVDVAPDAPTSLGEAEAERETTVPETDGDEQQAMATTSDEPVVTADVPQTESEEAADAPEPAMQLTTAAPLEMDEDPVATAETDTAETDRSEPPVTASTTEQADLTVIPATEPDAIDTAPTAPVDAQVQVPSEETPAAQAEVTEPTEDSDTTETASTGVRVNRPGAEPSEVAGQGAEIVTEDTDDTDAPALVRYAAAFENPDGLPLLSVILVDAGDDADAVDAITALPIPVTIILDPLQAGATARMRQYRAAGIEVAMQISLPLGATPTDVEVAFEAAFGTLPEAVALYSDGSGVLQSDRSVTDQVIEVLAADGRGLVAVERGLGSAVRAAQQADVPAATILRELDGANAAAIGRALDQAAFRTRQNGTGVLVGRVAPATLQALSNWAAEIETAQLQAAPLTAVLLAISE